MLENVASIRERLQMRFMFLRKTDNVRFPKEPTRCCVTKSGAARSAARSPEIAVRTRQGLIRIDDAMQIGIHQVHDDVDILKIRTSALFDQMWKRSNNTTN